MYIFVQGRNRLGEKKVLDRKKKVLHTLLVMSLQKNGLAYTSRMFIYMMSFLFFFFNASDSNIGTKKVRNLKGQMAIFNNTMLCTVLYNTINQ